MSLKSQIHEDIKSAMRSRESARVSALRLLSAAIKQREIDDRRELVDEDVVGVINKLVKQRRDSIEQYEAGNRQDLADAERRELDMLSAYLPAPISDSEIEAAIDDAIAESNADTMADMGKVMALLKPRLASRADMGNVSARVKSRLSG